MIYRSWRRSNSSAIRGKRTLGRQSQSVERVSVHSPQGDHHGDSGRANEILRERERRGLRRFTIDVSEDDLGVIAEHGYEVPQAPTRISRRKLLFIHRHARLARSAKVTALRRATPFQ